MTVSLTKINKQNGYPTKKEDFNTIDNNFQTIEDAINNSTSTITDTDRTNLNNIGDTTTLTESVVASIETNSNKIGDLSTLTTTDKTSIVNAIKENTQNITQLSNPNLLINDSFQIWQRGTTIGDIYNQYSADRWYCSKSANAHSFTQVANGMQVIRTATGSTYVEQFAELPKYKDSVMTLSTSINGVIYTVSGVPSSNSNSGVTASTAVGVINIAFDATRSVVKVTIRIDGVTATINWAKLELGSIATPFVPRLYAEELALCQRYFINLNSFKAGYAYFGVGSYSSGSTVGRMNIPLPVTMRIAPTPSVKGTVSANLSTGSVAISSLSIDQYSLNYDRLIMNLASTPTTTGICDVMAGADSNGSILLDAEIY
jgi:hypothetical protein